VPVNQQNAMVVGVDIVNAGRRAIIGMTASYSKHMTQHYSQVVYQDLLKDLVGVSLTKQEQEEKVCANRSIIVQDFLKKSLDVYF
jgi:hypothetical protein